MTIYEIDEAGFLKGALDLSSLTGPVPPHVNEAPPKLKKGQAARWDLNGWRVIKEAAEP